MRSDSRHLHSYKMKNSFYHFIPKNVDFFFKLAARLLTVDVILSFFSQLKSVTFKNTLYSKTSVRDKGKDIPKNHYG